MKYLLFIALISSVHSYSNESKCFGTTSNGSLENGVRLPASGKNFVAYSWIARVTGRTYVHSSVRDIVVASYASLEKEQPKKVYKYAETGFEGGGQFKPHKTHRNGLSIDFMTPMINSNGESVHLPTHLLNKFGYNIEIDKDGKFEDLIIDYEALAAHLVSLHKQSIIKGHDLWRVIFDPKLQPKLYETQYAEYLRENIQFSKKKSWVRHDEHYHVDFNIECY